MLANLSTQQDMNLLLVDDDEVWLSQLARAMERRGFTCLEAQNSTQAEELISKNNPAFAVIDLRLEDGSGLDVVASLRSARADVRIIILTGYGNIASAVEAVKRGAVDYLAKPADADEIHQALMATPGGRPPPPENPMSADRVRWEHIQRVFELCDYNVSETARRLSMHRRTLQRILAKRAPK